LRVSDAVGVLLAGGVGTTEVPLGVGETSPGLLVAVRGSVGLAETGGVCEGDARSGVEEGVGVGVKIAA